MTDTYVYRFYKRQDIQINTTYNAWQHLTVFAISFQPLLS